MKVQNDIRWAYKQLWNAEALKLSSGKYNYDGLATCAELSEGNTKYCIQYLNAIHKKYPIKLSEVTLN